MVHLDDEEKGILRYLPRRYDEALDLNDITKYLKDQGYEDISLKDVREDLDHLIKTGYVRSKTEKIKGDRKERFYLAKIVGEGGREQKRLQGKGFFRDLGKLVERWTGAFFLLFGLGFVAYEGLNATGAVISEGSNAGLTLIFAFALFIIGAVLLKKGFKK